MGRVLAGYMGLNYLIMALVQTMGTTALAGVFAPTIAHYFRICAHIAANMQDTERRERGNRLHSIRLRQGAI